MVAKKKSQKRTLYAQSNIDKLITYFLTIIIGAGLIFNGYFFEYQSLSVNIITGAFFLIVLVIYYNNKQPINYNKNVLLLGFMFLLINIIGFSYASNSRAALINILLIINALMIFILACQVFNKNENLIIFLKGFYWITFLISVIGIISFIFGINILNSYPSPGNRLFSTLGYPNTAALFFIVNFFIGFVFLKTSNNKDYLYLFANSILFLAFLGTKSRGVFLIFPILAIIYLVLLKKEDRMWSIKNLFAVVIPNTILFPMIYSGNINNRTAKDILLGLFVLFVLPVFYYGIKKLEFKFKKIITIFLIIFILIGVGTIVFTEEDEIYNNSVFQRLKTINLQNSSIMSRIIFMKDAIKIVKDHPILGVGAGGWNAEYKTYRSFLYFTSQVHNHYLQVMVENGILGFVVFIILWIILIVFLYKKLKLETSHVNISMFLVAIALALHSLMDFDLAYPVAFYLWWLLIAISLDKKDLSSFKFNTKRKLLLITIISLVIVVTLINSSILIGGTFGEVSLNNIKHEEVPVIIKQLETSVILDPLNSESLTKLAQVYLASDTEKNNYEKKALKVIDRAIKFNSSNFKWYLIKSEMLVKQKKYTEGYNVALKAISLNPLEELIYYNLAKTFIDNDINGEGLKYAKEIVEIAKLEGEKIERNEYKKWWRGKKLNKSGKLDYLKGRISLLEEQPQKVKIHFYKASFDKDIKNLALKELKKCYDISGDFIINGKFANGKIDGWHLVGKEGETRKIIKKNNSFWINLKKENNETRWWGIYQNIYDFQPRAKYNLSFNAFAKTNKDKIRIIVHQVGKDGGNPQKSIKLSINEEIQSYNWIFQTDNLQNKYGLRIFLLVPNDAQKQNVYITDIKLNKVN